MSTIEGFHCTVEPLYSCGHGRVGDETTGVVGGTISAMALVYCRSVKFLFTIPVCLCVCVCVCVCVCTHV